MNTPAPWLYDPKETARILQKYDFKFQRKFGQNFLIDAHVLEKIAAAAGLCREDYVLEIGPGIGTLTQYLAAYAGKVTAVEIDRNLLPILEETLAGYENVSIRQGDILQMDIASLAAEENAGRPIKVVANLPYYITTPIIMGLLEKQVPLTSITVMVQKEVADRMRAQPGTKDYGALSLAVQYYAEPYLAANVPPNCFIPRPEVASAVIRLSTRKEMLCAADEKLLFRLIRAAFGQRRKTLLNALRGSGEFSFTRQAWDEIFKSCGLDGNARGETMDLSQFIRLSDRIAQEG